MDIGHGYHGSVDKALLSHFPNEACKMYHQHSQSSVCSSVWVQYNTWKQKSGEKWGRPGNTCHVSHVVDVKRGGGGARLQICKQKT